jgi:hypothetical protein
MLQSAMSRCIRARNTFPHAITFKLYSSHDCADAADTLVEVADKKNVAVEVTSIVMGTVNKTRWTYTTPPSPPSDTRVRGSLGRARRAHDCTNLKKVPHNAQCKTRALGDHTDDTPMRMLPDQHSGAAPQRIRENLTVCWAPNDLRTCIASCSADIPGLRSSCIAPAAA